MTARATAQGHATTIGAETVAGANTATRVGANLKELADNCAFTEDVASGAAAGSMSAADFTKLAGISAGADVTSAHLGTSGLTACAGNDSRLSDARTPTAHAATHKSGGSDPIKLNELAAPTAAVALNAQEITGVAAPTVATSVARRAELDATVVVVAAATTAVLPAYTLTEGNPGGGALRGVGDTIQANANGAAPTVDGTYTPVVGDLLYLRHGAATSDNYIWQWTAVGGAGSKFALIRYSGLDTAAKIAASKFRVVYGEQSGGGEYCYKNIDAITMNVTALFAVRTDAGMGLNEGERWFDDCRAALVTVNITNGPGGLTNTFTGTGATCTQTNASANNAQGVYQHSMGTVVTNWGMTYCAGSGVTLAATSDIDVSFRFQAPVLSTVAQEFALNVGIMRETAASQVAPTNGMCLVYDRLHKGVNLWALTIAAGTSTGTFTDTGIVFNAAQWYRVRYVSRAGSGIGRFYIDGVLIATHSANRSSGLHTVGAFWARITGTTTGVLPLATDFVDYNIQQCQLRAA